MATLKVTKLTGIILGALLALATASYAGEKCGSGKCGGGMDSKKMEKNMDEKCGSGKCGTSKDMKKTASKCGGSDDIKKPASKCGAGKCGSGK
jgi:uncharacterized low-complexity protein